MEKENFDQNFRVVVPSPNGFIYKSTPIPKAQGTLEKRGRKMVKDRYSEISVRFQFLVISESINAKSH